MNILRRTAMAIGGMTVVALLIVLAAPKAAHGIVATLVQVTNTPARTAVLLTLGDSGRGDTVAIPDGQFGASFSYQDVNGIYVVPAGKRLVVDSIYGGMVLSAGQPLMDFTSSVNGLSGGFALALQPAPNGSVLFSADHKAYADSGTSVSMLCNRYPAQSGSASCFSSL